MKLPVLLMLFMICTIVHCTTQAQIGSVSNQYISWGNGGGFTNARVSYQLVPNGKITRSINEVESEEFRTIDESIYATMFEQFDSISMHADNLNPPGNIYYFIETTINGEVKRISWGGPMSQVPEPIRKYYLELVELIN